MSEFRIGDKVKLRYYRNKKEYERIQIQTGNNGWDYESHSIYYQNNKYNFSLVDYEDSDGRIYLKNNNLNFSFFWPFQIEKVNNFKTKIKFIKELL